MSNSIRAVPAAESPRGPSEDLLRHRRGEITEAEYLQTRIDKATAHLQGRVSPERMAMVREIVAQKLETDPVLTEAKARLLGKGSGTTGRGTK